MCGKNSIPLICSDDLSIEKLEEHLDTLKATFKEKEGLVQDIQTTCGTKILYPGVTESSRVNYLIDAIFYKLLLTMGLG